MTTPDGTHGMDDQNSEQDPQHTRSDDRLDARSEAGSATPAGSAGAECADRDQQAQDHAPGSRDADEHSGGHGFGNRGGYVDLDDRGETVDEAELRALLRDAVQGIDGAPDALEHLRRAIPARRQHRRQAMAGTAAALLLAGMAVPALIRAAGTGSSTDASPASLAGSHSAAPGEDGQADTWSGGPSGPASGGSKGSGATHQHSPPHGSVSSLPASPSGAVPVEAPDCSSDQLGQGASQAGAPDANGLVYGWFRVANVSGTACTVAGSGQVQALAKGGADPSRIAVVDHTPGDPASGLPAGSATPLVLGPGEDYEVQFAWVPQGTTPGGCPTPTTPPTTPTPTVTTTDPGSPGSDSAETGTDTGANAPAAGSDPPASPLPSSVVLNHTPAAGAPTVDGPVIQNACAGTVYTTTAMPAPTTGSGS